MALGPLSRVGDPGEGRTGLGDVALLAPDSVVYLKWSASWRALVEAPWPRWGYLLVLRVGDLLGDAPTAVVVLQVAATWTAGVALLRLGRRLAGPLSGVVAASALLLNPMTAQWTRFVLTEPMFYALAVGVVVAAAGPDGRRRRVVLMLLAAPALLLRPTGPLLAGAAVLLAITTQTSTPGARLIRAAAVAGATAAVLAVGAIATGPPAEGTFDAQLRAGVIVEGTPEVRTTIPMPPGSDGDGVASYIAEHPMAAVRLAVARVVVEVAQVRRHYPPAVNAALALAMLVLLGLAVVGLMDPRGHALRTPIAVVMVPLVGITAVSFAVPEGRYGWAGLVALMPAVGLGAQRLLERFSPQGVGGTAR